MYKKVNLKFSYDKYRREDRVEQTLKARESSRFKRLSAIRNFENSDLIQSGDENSKLAENEHEKLENKMEKKIVKRPLSRLEMLKKWKEEQQKRREEEMKKKQLPFVVGRAAVKKPVFNKVPQSLNTTVKSQNSRLAISKNLPKSTNGNNSIKVTPASIKTTKIGSLQKSSNQISSSAKTSSKNEKAPPIKSISKIGLKEKPSSSFKPISYQSHQPKPMSMIPSKPAQKPSSETLKCTLSRKVAEVPKSIPGVLKGIPLKNSSKTIPIIKAPSKIQAPVTSRLPAAGMPKLSAKPCVKTPVKRTIKGPSVFTGSNGSQKGLHTGVVKAVSDNTKKTAEKMKISEKVPACEVRDNMDLTFNSEISIIKPSFAPANFVFEPPAELREFGFGDDDDDDDDPFAVLEKVKRYLSRTSTPGKLSGSSSSSKRSSTSGSETPQKLPEKSANAEIPDLMNTTPQPLKDENIAKKLNDEPANTNNTFVKSPDKSADSNVEVSDLISTSILPLKNEVILSDKPVDLDVLTTAETAVMKLDKFSDTFPREEETVANTDDGNLMEENPVAAVLSETAEMEKATSNDISTVKENSVETDSKIDSHEPQCDAIAGTLKSTSADNIALDDSLGIIDMKTVVEAVSKTCNDATLCNDLLNNYTSPDNFQLDDSLGIIDINMKSSILEPINLMKLEENEVFKNDSSEPETIKPVITKSAGAIPKRTSILKSISTLEAISEVSELDSSKERVKCVGSKQDVGATPRRSNRLSGRRFIKESASDLEKIIDLESPPYSPSFMPRRSARLQKTALPKLVKAEEAVSSPSAPRRSMRLIDLNTPEKKKSSKTDLTLNFEKLNLNDSENMDPQLMLSNLESPDINKSKKVSLLYTPDRKRRSIRKSIRGDLMSFSPI